MEKPGKVTSPAYVLYRLGLSIADWLFPPECGGCGKGGFRWCDTCDGEIELILENYCKKCGLPNTPSGICDRCSTKTMAFDAARSLGLYQNSMRKAVLKLKYNRDYGLGETLSIRMLELIRSLDWGVEIVVPIPLGKKRKTQRGYNQAEVLAKPISLGLGVPMRTDGLVRIRETESQVGLTETERRKNVSRAFISKDRVSRDQTFLLVDDVMTTGATMDSCAKALKEAGAGKVYCLTLARALDTRVQ